MSSPILLIWDGWAHLELAEYLIKEMQAIGYFPQEDLDPDEVNAIVVLIAKSSFNKSDFLERIYQSTIEHKNKTVVVLLDDCRNNLRRNKKTQHLVDPILIRSNDVSEGRSRIISQIDAIFERTAILHASAGRGPIPTDHGDTITGTGTKSKWKAANVLEWFVAEKNDEFEEAIHNLITLIADLAKTNLKDIAITLYGHSTRFYRGEGSFEYDLLYYWNVKDPSLMFGPVIKDDTRTIVGDNEERWDFNDEPSGGFVERENIKISAWFKLGKNFWSDNALEDFTEDNVTGLLFVNLRSRSLVRNHLENNVALARALEALEHAITSINQKREKQKLDRINLLGNEINENRSIRALASRRSVAKITASDIHEFFARLVSIYEKIINKGNLSFTVFHYDPDKDYLIWLWSNSPTTIPVVNDLNDQPKNSKLIFQVANDPRLRPRIVNHVLNENFKDLSIVTKHGSHAQANIAIPIFPFEDETKSEEDNAKDKLLGILDIQASQDIYFDTDDVQFAYRASQEYIADFLSRIRTKHLLGKLPPTLIDNDVFESMVVLDDQVLYNLYNNRPPDSIGGNTRVAIPFNHKRHLDFSLQDLVKLNFNPMKYLFHWDRIEKLVSGEPTDFPATIEIWPSMACNHACVWCRTKDDRRLYYDDNNEVIFKEGLIAIAKDLAQHNHVDLLISGGGEPMLNPHIADFVETLNMELSKNEVELGTVGIFTNGTRPENQFFWEKFFSLKNNHSFIRISFNGHNPDLYSKIHFPSDQRAFSFAQRAYEHSRQYAEARKTVLDLLAMRPAKTTISMGSTVIAQDQDTIVEQITHAKRLGSDFIQIRPELRESTRTKRWKDIKSITTQESKKHTADNFAVVYTDNERAYKNHDYDTCYAMHLVPAITPHPEDEDWLIVWPCSYAINRDGTVPKLGLMREGTKISDFWDAFNQHAEDDDNFRELRGIPIDPSKGCPQCRYYMLNKRIIALKEKVEDDKLNGTTTTLDLLNDFVQQLRDDPDNVDADIMRQIGESWPDEDMLDPTRAVEAFSLSHKLDIRPSL